MTARKKTTVAINCWILKNKNLDGIGYFTINTFPRIIAAHPEVDFIILCDTGFDSVLFDFANVTLVKCFPKYRHPLLYIYYLEFKLPTILKKYHVDVVVAPDGFISLMSRCRQIAFMHDINFAHHPENMDIKNRLWYNYFFPRYAKKADRIMTISQYSKADIMATYKVPDTKIGIVYLAASDAFKPISEARKIEVRNTFSSGEPYFFFVGSLHPRKNITRLIQAFEKFKDHSNSPIKLVLAGAILWKTSDIETIYRQSKWQHDILFVGRVSDEELYSLTAAAFASTFVTLFEGFGLPIAEAMKAGTAVICSNTTAMPEVGGEAVLYADPYSVDSISEAMHKMTDTPGLREELVQRGFEQVQKFSWNKTADELWNNISMVLKAN